MGQNQRNTKDVSETESQSPSKGDTVEDLHLEHKLNNVENKGNSDIGGESSHVKYGRRRSITLNQNKNRSHCGYTDAGE